MASRLTENERLLQVRITAQQRRELRTIAALADSDVSSLVRTILTEFLARHRGVLSILPDATDSAKDNPKDSRGEAA